MFEDQLGVFGIVYLQKIKQIKYPFSSLYIYIFLYYLYYLCSMYYICYICYIILYYIILYYIILYYIILYYICYICNIYNILNVVYCRVRIPSLQRDFM